MLDSPDAEGKLGNEVTSLTCPELLETVGRTLSRVDIPFVGCPVAVKDERKPLTELMNPKPLDVVGNFGSEVVALGFVEEILVVRRPLSKE
jgi:hypothetical protein